MFKTYRGPIPIHPRRYELPLGTCRSGDLNVYPSHSDEHDARDRIRLYKDTMREDAMEFGDPLVSVRSQTQQQLIVVRIAVYNSGDMDKVARIDQHDEKRRKWKAHHRIVCKYRANISQAAPSKDDNPS